MRVAMFSWETLHSIPVGGVSAHVSELGDALGRRGHEVHIFTRMGPGQGRYDRVDGVHYHRCPFGWDPDFVREVSNMCDSFAWHMGETAAAVGGFDVAHAHDWLAGKALVQARNHHGMASVFTIHSTEYGRCGNANHGGRSSDIRHMEWEAGFCSDQVIAVSGVIGREYGRLYSVPSDKINPIYNGVQPRRFETPINVAAERARYGIGAADPMVLFCGRLAWQKGPDILIEAVPAVLRRYPQAKIVLAGDGEMRWGLEQRATALGIAHAMRFVGFRRGVELANLFKAADAVCVPSRNEPFGIVILEAWSAGKAVIVTHNGGPAEFVRHGQDGLKVYDHADSIRWGIVEALDHPAQARAMGRAGRQRVAREFSWDRIASQTEAVYSRAIMANRLRLGLAARISDRITIELGMPAAAKAA